ncbi:transcription initiation factor TFIID subunit 11 [Fopius arisanus]|uniref:Transcription initiation factor TFIID subunit 11 n=1 Tax=Fopius arisanus TaxID=64838 RepID=A0A9R1TZA8_9HYME|nr:PREDICTED: transcription initiation factor TFIID subunit 11-like [Fopius arisanus]
MMKTVTLFAVVLSFSSEFAALVMSPGDSVKICYSPSSCIQLTVCRCCSANDKKTSSSNDDINDITDDVEAFHEPVDSGYNNSDHQMRSENLLANRAFGDDADGYGSGSGEGCGEGCGEESGERSEEGSGEGSGDSDDDDEVTVNPSMWEQHVIKPELEEIITDTNDDFTFQENNE